MDSPIDSDHLPEFPGVKHYFLPEDLIISSQPFPVLLEDAKKEAEENEVNLSVMIDELHSDEVTNLIHARPDCVIYPFSKDPKPYCKKCFCCKCQIPASKCRWWEKHCSLSGVVNMKEGEKKLANNSKGHIVSDNEQSNQNVRTSCNNYQKRAEHAEEALVELKKLVGSFQKRAEEAEAAITEIKSIIGNILDGSKGKLKVKCIEKGIKVSGKSGMKHKYAWVLLENFFGKA